MAASPSDPALEVIPAPDSEPGGDQKKESEGGDEATAEVPAGAAAKEEGKRSPGWPGLSVFRLIVPVGQAGALIGHKGEVIKKLCVDTHASIRVLVSPIGTYDRIVLIFAKEEPEAEIAPAMDAVLRVVKRVNGIIEGAGDTSQSTDRVRLLVAETQALSLIGKQGTLITSIKNDSGALVHVLSGADERIVEIQGESLKVLKALEAVVGHLRKFLVHHSVIPLFEKNLNTPVNQVCPVDATQPLIIAAQQSGSVYDYPLSLKHGSSLLDHGPALDSQFQLSGPSCYGQNPALSGAHSSGLERTADAVVTQITRTMHFPSSYAEDIIGVRGANIKYVQDTSGAAVYLKDTRGVSDEIKVEIMGTTFSQIHLAERIIQDLIPARGAYGSGTYIGRASTAYPSPSSGFDGYRRYSYK